MNHNQSHSGVDPYSGSYGSDPPEASWPVLARLPRVGEAASQSPAVPRIDGRSPSPGHVERRSESIARGEPRQIDAHYMRYDAGADLARSSDESPPTAAARQWRYRIDPGSGTQNHFSGGSAHAPRSSQVRETLASRLFQWHASLAPQAGVAVMLLLVATAGTLYWFGFGRSDRPADRHVEAIVATAPEAAPTSGNRNPLPLAESAPTNFNGPAAPTKGPQVAVDEDATEMPAIDWSPAAPDDPEQGATAQQESLPLPTPELQPPQTTLTPPAPMTGATTGATLPITPTAVNTLGGYPITPFPSFNVGTLQSIVAELPMAAPSAGAAR